ncbi:MAG: sarcosine oxidase subunit gamma family protein [Boseongicola sp.]
MSYEATIRRVGAMALFDLKGPQAALSDWAGEALPLFPNTPNTATLKDEAELLFVGRNHWLLRAPLEREAEFETVLRPEISPPEISLVRVSDTQTFFSITGQDADQIMSIASPLDVHPSVFPENGATFSEVFGLKALILKQSEGFCVAVEQSFGDMIEDYFARAMS